MEEEEKKNRLSLDDQEEWTEIIESWIDGRNTITYAELLVLTSESEHNDELEGTLIEHLEQLGVTVLDPEDEDSSDADGSVPVDRRWEIIETEDLLDVYLAELAREPLLSHAEEIELARKVELGHQAAEALQATDYTAAEYSRLETVVETGRAARERLGSANTRLVVSIAKRYRGYGIPFPDLIQNGNVGLMRAVDHYDHRTGYRFSTYATWWIRQAVTRSLSNHGRVIRIPVHTGARIRRMNQVAQRLEMEHGQRPTAEDLATALGETPEKIRQMMRWVGDTVSLERPVGQERDIELQDLIEDENAEKPEDMTDSRLLSDVLSLLMGNLSVREAQILRLRYGLDGSQTYTLAEIGKKLKLSRERIRQIEREALAKMRLVAPNHRLEHFL